MPADTVVDLAQRAIDAKDEREREHLCQELITEVRRSWELQHQSGDEFDERAGNREVV
jgi:hypothetical protein